jgi:hypothetical protein
MLILLLVGFHGFCLSVVGRLALLGSFVSLSFLVLASGLCGGSLLPVCP